jgi:membrane-bound metal-dependent hydrolase YbcI (DUF457 family)
MMGPTHSASGAAAGIGTALLLASSGVAVTPAEAIVFTGVTAGAALLPDLDHPSATIARTFGPVSKAASKLVNTLAGGHRKGTHTLLGVAAMAALAWVLVTFGGKWGALGLFFVLVTFTLHSWLRPVAQRLGSLGSLVAAVALTGVVAVHFPSAVSAPVLALAVIVGGLAHILGDAVTVSGVPSLLSPLGGWRTVHVLPKGLRFTASGPMDRVLLIGFSLLAAGLLWVGLSSPDSLGVVWA